MEYNLRKRAEIVLLAQEVAKSLKADPLIEYFEGLYKERRLEEEFCGVCNEYEFKSSVPANTILGPCEGCGIMRPVPKEGDIT